MGSKKQRNKERNERKARERQAQVETQIAVHNQKVYRDGFSKMRSASAGVNPLDPILKANELYQKVPADQYWIEAREDWAIGLDLEPEIPGLNFVPIKRGWIGMVMCNITGTPEIMNKLAKPADTYLAAVMRAHTDFEVLAIKMEDGNFRYPYYDETKGRLMAEAEERRRRRAKVVMDRIGLMIAVGSMADTSRFQK